MAIDRRSLGSALREDEQWVTALPHGLYCNASADILEAAFGLRHQTPHNFLVLRPEPEADTDSGGVYIAPRSSHAGSGVFVPQLIVDLHRSGGRGPEQAERLLDTWAQGLPVRSIE